MLERIKFGDGKVNTKQIENEWFVTVWHIFFALGVSFQERKLVLIGLMI